MPTLPVDMQCTLGVIYSLASPSLPPGWLELWCAWRLRSHKVQAGMIRPPIPRIWGHGGLRMHGVDHVLEHRCGVGMPPALCGPLPQAEGGAAVGDASIAPRSCSDLITSERRLDYSADYDWDYMRMAHAPAAII